ncbi:hypothetical protein HD553DRAFT_339623 [Filobasidium floriforme]|uniref:uncharacterized protein n=1 Tax=Filobasidium floriforme TaxID=5210 RepID=UPI001E8D381D|nr:uncharacterized protein HD553DRAFT_339623 [Filobasidium floriforme]KAH8088279.1 hypothetical protein HD553DRAFT_339623 [Filobasidium floriforme]
MVQGATNNFEGVIRRELGTILSMMNSTYWRTWKDPGRITKTTMAEMMDMCWQSLPSSTNYIGMNCLSVPASLTASSFGDGWKLNHGWTAIKHVKRSARMPDMGTIADLIDANAWYLFTSAYALTEPHVDLPGWLTYVKCITGSKIWTIYQKMFVDIEDVISATHLLLLQEVRL